MIKSLIKKNSFLIGYIIVSVALFALTKNTANAIEVIDVTQDDIIVILAQYEDRIVELQDMVVAQAAQIEELTHVQVKEHRRDLDILHELVMLNRTEIDNIYDGLDAFKDELEGKMQAVAKMADLFYNQINMHDKVIRLHQEQVEIYHGD